MSKNYPITIEIEIKIAGTELLTDVAFLQLKSGVGDKNQTSLSDEDFTGLVIAGNIIVALLREDPIAYAIVENGEIKESYIEYGFRQSNLESAFVDFLKNS